MQQSSETALQAGTVQLLTGLPADGMQPWEALDAGGFVIPASRITSSINLNTDFTPGVERFLDSGDAADNLEATRLNGTDATGTSYAMYRVTMGAEQPGIVSVDANLISGKGYYVGLSNYGTGRWDWHGPFTDNHVRLQAVTDSSGDLTSALGNTFVSVLCPAGTSADVVGVGINQYDPSSAEAPAEPTALQVVPVAAGLELSWEGNTEPDLAGYRILFSDASFINPDAVAVRHVPYLEGTTRHLLSGLSGETFVAIQAIDFGGNVSEPSVLQSATPLAGAPGQLTLSASLVSGLVGASISLTASGESSYDWDLDGDGVFEVLADSEGLQQLDTSAAGIIRPRVRGTDSEAVALGGLSLLIGTNSRPLAEASADPLSGFAPLEVSFSGNADDLEDDNSLLEYAWDFDGDGIYEADTDTLTPDPVNYPDAGIFNARLRVTDTGGLFDTDPVAIQVSGNFAPLALLRLNAGDQPAPYDAQFDASSSTDTDGSIVKYEWDWDNDGTYDEDTGTDPLASHLFELAGDYSVTLRITDDLGSTDTDTLSFTASGWALTLVDDSGDPSNRVRDITMEVFNGKPAVAYTIHSDFALRYVVSSTLNGEQAEDWSDPVIVDDSGFFLGIFSLAEVDGNPAIAYTDNAGFDLKYARSTTASGAQAADWSQIVTLNIGDGTGIAPSLAVVDGNPAISFQDGDSDFLMYTRSNTSTGSMAADWDTLVTLDTSTNAGYKSKLRVIDGKPAIAYCRLPELCYIRSSTATGSTALDWDPILALDAFPDTPEYVGLIIADGNPAIATYDIDNDAFLFYSSTTPDGGLLGNWQSGKLGFIPQNGANTMSLALVDGTPAMCFTYGSKLGFASSSSPFGLPKTTWESEFAEPLPGNLFRDTSLAEVDGRAAIAYVNGFGDLIYGIIYE
ncbi:PKD domain-containing protein [bacterium]|nr:PKD domain-containing protein [bacterium]